MCGLALARIGITSQAENPMSINMMERTIVLAKFQLYLLVYLSSNQKTTPRMMAATTVPELNGKPKLLTMYISVSPKNVMTNLNRNAKTIRMNKAVKTLAHKKVLRLIL